LLRFELLQQAKLLFNLNQCKYGMGSGQGYCHWGQQ